MEEKSGIRNKISFQGQVKAKETRRLLEKELDHKVWEPKSPERH
jgi:hypothetical protein